MKRFSLCDLINVRCQFFGVICPRKRPADVAGGVTNIGANREVGSFLVVVQCSKDNWNNLNKNQQKKIQISTSHTVNQMTA